MSSNGLNMSEIKNQLIELKVGSKAPGFEVFNQKGELIRLQDLRGKKVILFFYPKDMTDGCTAEVCNLRDNFSTLKNKGFKLFGISGDSMKSHVKFIDQYSLQFDLLADEDLSMCKAYGVWGEKELFGRKYMGIIRTTFIIDEEGKIEAIIPKVDTGNHTAQILEAIQQK